MAKRKKSKHHKKIGQVPGTLIYTGDKLNDFYIELFDYNLDKIEEKKIKLVEDVFKYKTTDSVTWINFNGLSHIEQIEKIGKHYDLHPLVLEDIVNTSHLSKIDEFEAYIFIVLKMLYYDEKNTLVSEQVSFILGHNFVLTFQEAEGDVFDALRDRIRTAKGRIRGLGSDYLLYTLIDAVTDHYYSILETIEDKIEDLEDNLFNGQSHSELSQQIQALKREILKIRRAIFPLREIISRIEKTDHILILDKTLHYYRDIYDHIIQVSENIDIYREMTWGLMDMYMTAISNRMNEVMKVLTIIATIFIPMTFITGVYGMNFEYLPELKYKYSYLIFWFVMIVLFLGMLWYFKKKKWL